VTTEQPEPLCYKVDPVQGTTSSSTSHSGSQPDGLSSGSSSCEDCRASNYDDKLCINGSHFSANSNMASAPVSVTNCPSVTTMGLTSPANYNLDAYYPGSPGKHPTMLIHHTSSRNDPLLQRELSRQYSGPTSEV